MKSKILPLTALLCLYFGMTISLQAQEECFEDPVENPFGLFAPEGGVPAPAADTNSIVRLVDIDHDGVLEAFIHSGTDEPGYPWQDLNYFENVGTNDAPEFEYVASYPFGIPSNIKDWLWQFADVDGDGLEDLITFSFKHNNPITIIFNTGTADTADFSGDFVYNPYGITLPVSSVDGSEWDGAAPTFIDINADGALDIFFGGLFINSHADDGFYYSENKGSATAPEYDTPLKNPFGLTFPTGMGLHWEGFGDVDCDGDLDLFIIKTNPFSYYFFENIGTATSPEFAPPQPIPTNTDFLPTIGSFIDIGNDGDLDLIMEVEGIGIGYFEHLGCNCLTSVREDEFNSNIVLAPNPVQDKLNLTLRSEAFLGNVGLQIFDPMGKLVFAKDLGMAGSELTETLDVGQIPPGIYFLKIDLGENTLVRKFVKN